MNDKKPGDTEPPGSTIINVIQEQIKVHKEVVEKGKVHIEKKVHEAIETVQIPLASEEVVIQKIVIQKIVDTMPAIRYEGDTMIIPVVKEVAVVEKKLMLVEEVYVTKKTSSTTEEVTMPLRREEVNIERTNS